MTGSMQDSGTIEAPEPVRFQGEALVAGLAATRDAWLACARDPDPMFSSVIRRMTGLPEKHALETVRRAFQPFTTASLRRLVRIGGYQVGSDEGPWLLAITPGTVPAVAVNVLMWSLCAGVPVLFRPSSVLAGFVRLLADSLVSIAPSLARSVGVLSVDSSSKLLRRALSEAPLCIAYGSDHTLQAIRAARGGLPTLEGGHKESFVVVFADALAGKSAGKAARAVARDVVMYDQSGCLSPQAVLVEEGGEVDPAVFARFLYEALEYEGRKLRPGPMGIYTAAAIRAFAAECRYLAAGGRGLVLQADRGLVPLVVVLRASPYRPGPGHRCLQVLPFSGEPDLPALLPDMSGKIQGFAVAGDRERALDLFERFPGYAPNHLCRPGRLQRPPAIWPENGRIVTRELAAMRSAASSRA